MSTYGTATANGPSTGGGESGDSTAQQAKERAQETAQQAKGRVRDEVDQRSTEAGQRVSRMAGDARSVSAELRKQGNAQPARLAEQAAQRAESLGEYLQRSDGDTILRDLEEFGRRRPWAVVAGGLALGVAASRFLKASSSRRYQSRWESSDRLPARREDVAPPTAAPPTRPDVPATATGAGEFGGAGAGLPGRDPRIG